MATGTHDELDFGEDLFDFDELLRTRPQDTDEINSALDAVIETTGMSDAGGDVAGDDSDLFADVPAAALPAVTHRVQPKPPPLAAPNVPARGATFGSAPASSPAASPAPIPAPLAQASEPVAALPAGPATSTTTVLQRITLSPALSLLLALIALLNVALVGYVVRALSSVETMVLDVGNQVVTTAEQVRDEASTLAQDYQTNSRPVVSARPEGLTAIERAAELIDSGAFERGRQTLFALLAVIDRVPADVRVDIEARARFMLADSWRLEADALQSDTRMAGRRAEDAQ